MAAAAAAVALAGAAMAERKPAAVVQSVLDVGAFAGVAATAFVFRCPAPTLSAPHPAAGMRW